MNVLLIDVYGMYLDFALDCQKWGHEVRTFHARTAQGLWPEIGRGLTKVVRDWESSMGWADVILVADNVRYIHALEGYRRRGYPIWGPNLAVAEWELNRERGQDIFRAAGIRTMASFPFKSLTKAQEFLAAHPKRYVSKPNAEDNKALSYVSKSPRDLMFMLEYWQKNSKVKADFILQEFTPGVEVAVGGWFGQGGFTSRWLENFEHKKLMAGEKGPNTGEMGTVMKYVEKSALADILLKPLEGELYRQGYTGYIDVSAIVAKNGDPLPLEATARPGWPLDYILRSLHVGDPVEWVLAAINGRDIMKVTDDVALGVLIALPEFPYTHGKDVCGFPVYGWDKVPEKNFHPWEMRAGEVWDDSLKKVPGRVTAGDCPCVISGNGGTVREAREAAYSHISKVEIPNSPMYRLDIGGRLEEDLKVLKGHGFCQDWRW